MFDPDTVVVSAHFDDAVLCLGAAVAGAAHPPRVVTVCAGVPGGAPEPSSWDQLSGFTSGVEAALVRRQEDLAAAAVLGFDARHLDFVDEPYASQPWPVDDLAAALDGQVAGARAVYAPAGIGGHPDHVRTRDATLRAAMDQGVAELWLYADLPYAMVSPHWPSDRFHNDGAGHSVLEPMAALGAQWHLAEPRYLRVTDADWPRKRAAVLAYASQMAPLSQLFPGFLAWPGPLQTEAVWAVTAHGAAPRAAAPASPRTAVPASPRTAVPASPRTAAPTGSASA